MSRKYDNVLVFGASGAVGGLVALEAHNRGAKVWLAMRDTSKPIPAIPSEVEKAGNFVRVQADLSDPASVAKAVAKSGAQAAYFYVINGGPDFGRAALQAMRDNGVEYVVFLSSYSVKGEGAQLRAIPPTDWIPYEHARVEINVEDLGFPYFTTLRPARFASNYFRLSLDRSVKPPKANIVAGCETARFDDITPEDIGAVGGAVLVERPSDTKETIWLCGPETRTAKEGWELIKKVTGRNDIDTTPITAEHFLEKNLAKGLPRPLVESLLSSYVHWQLKMGFEEPEYEVGVANITKYTGRAPTTFVEYLEAHKGEWVAV
uniref:NmrA-like domain-containing protein n=1 Tax=Mycena chlorophos TaxID=658473 RepID=A0ABQ0M0M3_MYCCL|nr:predicted protein [Mycena chlorophos]